MAEKRKIYIKVSADKYELPVGVADTVQELALLTGVHISSVWRGLRNSKKQCNHVRQHLYECVEVDWEDDDDV